MSHCLLLICICPGIRSSLCKGLECWLQVHIYLPENGHPATGLVRTVVKDSTDLDTSAFMDSDGHYSDNNPRNSPNPDPVDDGSWHMVQNPPHGLLAGSAGLAFTVTSAFIAGAGILSGTLLNHAVQLSKGKATALPLYLQQAAMHVQNIPYSCDAEKRDSSWLELQVTLTTHADGGTGYLVYLDGNLAASLPSTDPKALNATLDNVNLLLDGGRPIFLQVCLPCWQISP